MGLDIVEMIMDVEERFGIEISDEKVPSLRTAGDIADLVYSELNRKGTGPTACLNLIAYARLRAVFRDSRPVHSLRLDTPLLELFPLGKRYATWHHVERVSGLKLPPLEMGSAAWLVCIAVFLATLIGVYGGFIAFRGSGGLFATLATTILGSIIAFSVAAALWLFMSLLMIRVSNVLPPNCKYFGDLIRQCATLNTSNLRSPKQSVSRADCWQGVVESIANTTGIPLAEIHYHSDLVRDLELG